MNLVLGQEADVADAQDLLLLCLAKPLQDFLVLRRAGEVVDLVGVIFEIV